MRDEGAKVIEAIEEAVRAGREAGARVELSHFKIDTKSLWGASDKSLALVEKYRQEGVDVVIGYLDTQITHGWHSDHLYIHGTYADEEVAALLAAYGAKLALFPNAVPESFSYTLSDVWASGVPALYVALTDDHAQSASAFETAGLGLCLGLADSIDDQDIAQGLKNLLADASRRREMRTAGLMTLDGEGANRIAKDLASLIAGKGNVRLTASG